MSDFWTKSNRKPIDPPNYQVNQDNSWIGPTIVGLILGLVFIGFFL